MDNELFFRVVMLLLGYMTAINAIEEIRIFLIKRLNRNFGHPEDYLLWEKNR